MVVRGFHDREPAFLSGFYVNYYDKGSDPVSCF